MDALTFATFQLSNAHIEIIQKFLSEPQKSPGSEAGGPGPPLYIPSST